MWGPVRGLNLDRDFSVVGWVRQSVPSSLEALLTFTSKGSPDTNARLLLGNAQLAWEVRQDKLEESRS